MTRTAYLAPDGFMSQLLRELPMPVWQDERLALCHGEALSPRWAQNIWYNAQQVPFKSIKDASRILREHGRNWCHYPISHHRRALLIKDQLPHISFKPRIFGTSAPQSSLGSWGLLDANTLLFSAQCSSRFPNGDIIFEENHVEPPSRAYLKLWDFFTYLDRKPKAGSRCIELGAAPGGWTWVLAKFCGAHVTGIDRADLDERLKNDPLVTLLKGDAFQVDPKKYSAEPLDWFFSDLICYPEKLWQTVQKWIEADACKNFVCTLKFQGDEHYGAIESFLSLPGSQITHLSHNKHELTWWWIREENSVVKLDL